MLKKLLVLCLLIFISADASKIKIGKSTVYNGTIAGENNNFIILSVNGASIQILKTMISEIDGKPYDPKVAVLSTATAVSETAQQTTPVKPAVSQPVSPVPPAKGTPVKYVNVVLQNGKAYSGILVSEDDRAMQINVDGTQVGVIKDSISGMEKSDSKTPENKPVAEKTVIDPARNKESASADSSQKVNINPIGQNKNTVKTDSVPKTAAKVSETAIVKPIPVAVAKRALSDGTIEIQLKNGASFVGKIISENDRVVRFESDGIVINIIRQLIKNIDGVPYDTGRAGVTDSLFGRRDDVSEKSSSQIKEPETQPDLRRMFPSETVAHGVKITTMIDSLHSKNWEVRSSNARSLAVTGQWGTEAIPQLKELLSDTEQMSVYEPAWIDSTNVNKLLSPGAEAARALARMGDAGFASLRTLSKDTNALVRRRAAFGLGELPDGRSWPLLAEMLKDTDRGVRAVAVCGLRSSEYIDRIIEMLKDEDAEVRADAAFMLGRLRDKKAIKSLRTLLYDKRTIVRIQAADALCKIGGSEAIRQLISATLDATISIRENAAFALGETGDSLGVQPLINLLHDKMISVRIVAIDALAKIRDPRAIPSLYSMLKDDDPQVREQGVLALKKHTDIAMLIDALDNKIVNVHNNAQYMLWLMSGQSFDDKAQWQEWYTKSQEPVPHMPSRKK